MIDYIYNAISYIAEQLKLQSKNDKYNHIWLLYGDEGMGKSSIANKFANTQKGAISYKCSNEFDLAYHITGTILNDSYNRYLNLYYPLIKKVKEEAADMVKTAIGKDLVKIVLYGSCARGDYTQDSDIDIALITRCGRMEAKKYDDGLDEISVQLAMKYFAVVNFVCLPYDEFLEKEKWYLYFRNIVKDGEVLYG